MVMALKGSTWASIVSTNLTGGLPITGRTKRAGTDPINYGACNSARR